MKKNLQIILSIVALLGAVVMLFSTLCPWFDGTATINGEPQTRGDLVGLETVYGAIVFVLALVSAICILMKQYGAVVLLGISAALIALFYGIGQDAAGNIIHFTNGKGGADKVEMYCTYKEWAKLYTDMASADCKVLIDVPCFGAQLAIVASLLTSVCSIVLYILCRKAKKENA